MIVLSSTMRNNKLLMPIFGSGSAEIRSPRQSIEKSASIRLSDGDHGRRYVGWVRGDGAERSGAAGTALVGRHGRFC